MTDGALISFHYIFKRKTTMIKISQAVVEMPANLFVVSKFPCACEGKEVSGLLGITPIWKIILITQIFFNLMFSCYCVNGSRFH